MSSSRIAKIKEIKLVYVKNNEPRKQVDYIASLEPLKSCKELVGIHVPIESDLPSDYNLEELIQHIRLDQSKTINRVKIIVDDQAILDQEHIWEKVFRPDTLYSEISTVSLEPISEIRWEEEFSKTNNDPRKTSGNRHDLANKWGVYRLHRFLNEFGLNNDKYLEVNKHDLANSDVFFKKQLYKEKEEFSRTAFSRQINIKKLLGEIKKNFKKIALVDDLAKFGWEEAFSYIFGGNKVDSFKNVNEFIKEKKNWHKYDIILLDLRLEENDSDSDIILSGNRLLKKIKSIYPELPVIIITASNKYYSLRDSIDFGANEFWVKETHELGISRDYNYQNSIKLLLSIKKVIEWNNSQRKLIKLLNRIERKIVTIWEEKGIKRRKAFVTAQLYNQFSSFLETNLGNTIYESSFLTIYSMLIEIIEYYFPPAEPIDSEEGKYEIYYYDGFDRELLAYEFRRSSNSWQYQLNDNLPRKLREGTGLKRSIERFKINYLIYKNNHENFSSSMKKYERLRKKRNKLTFTHGNYDSTRSSQLTMKDLIDIASFVNDICLSGD